MAKNKANDVRIDILCVPTLAELNPYDSLLSRHLVSYSSGGLLLPGANKNSRLNR